MILTAGWLLPLTLQTALAGVVTYACAQFPFFRGIEVASFRESMLLAVIFAAVQGVLGYFLAPLNWITLGIFGVALSAAALELADFFVEGVNVKSWGWALLLGAIISGLTLALRLWVG